MVGNVFHLDSIKLSMKFFYILLFIILYLSVGTAYSDNMIIDNIKNSENSSAEKKYCENSSTKWCFVTDKVMGGVSEGTLAIKNDEGISYYKMQGNVSTENNGGFIQFRTKIINHPKDKLFKAVKIKVRGNNEQYAVHLRTKYLFFPWQYYESIFMADNKWQTIELPLKNFKKSNFYQPSEISSIDINTIGIVAIGRDFQADVDLSFIELTE